MSLLTSISPSISETDRFVERQKHLVSLYQRLFPDPKETRTIIVVPSLTLDVEELQKISGVHHYEERLLCLLMLLRMPRTHLIYLTSQRIDPMIIDYFLHLLPGVPSSHARRRLTLLNCHDASLIPLTKKILDRPRLIQRILSAIPNIDAAHMTCFNVTALERSLALRLNVPIYGCNPDLASLGSKSGSRDIFQQAGIPIPEGFGHLRDETDIVSALAELKGNHPDVCHAVIKLNEGFSGEGNAIFSYEGCPTSHLDQWVKCTLQERIQFEAPNETWERYLAKFKEMGGIVERYIEAHQKRSPSTQCRINPLGQVELVSTHDQVLGGPSGQRFLGSMFPADPAYRLDIQTAGHKVAHVLNQQMVLGRFSVDFVSVPNGEAWNHYAVEINLRKGGTTHTFMMLEMLIDGKYDPETGLYLTSSGRPRYYYASDNVENPAYKGLTPDDLIDIAVHHDLHFHSANLQGVVFHLIGALSEFGKLGMVCIGDSPERAKDLYKETLDVLNCEVA